MIIAGNGRVLKAYMFIMWLYLFKKKFNVNIFSFFLFLFWFITVLHLMLVVYKINLSQQIFLDKGLPWHRQRAKKPTVFPNISVLGWNIFLAGNKLNEKRLLSYAISGILKLFTLSLHGGIKFATQISLLLNYCNKKKVWSETTILAWQRSRGG